jgi:hypothetical protein
VIKNFFLKKKEKREKREKRKKKKLRKKVFSKNFFGVVVYIPSKKRGISRDFFFQKLDLS